MTTMELQFEAEPAAVTLAEILDQDSLQRVCMSYARMFGTGLTVVDTHGQVLVDIPAEHPLCRRLGAHPVGASTCGRFERLIQNEAVVAASDAVTQPCTCGLQYEILGIRHQGALLGRAVFGPYRAERMMELSEELQELLGETGADVLRAATGDLLRLEVLPRERALLAVHSLGEVLSVIVQTGYARHLTSQIHIAAIQDAYNELTEKNRRLADSVEKLKELDKLKSNFLATVSHELRTPLTSVIGYSEMLLEGLAGPLAGEQRDYVQIIMEKGDQLLQIINEVLDISKIETGGVQLSLDRMSLPELIRQVGDAMMPQARRKDITLTCEAPSSLPPILADRVKTRQVLLNLVSNAIKFTPRGGRVEMGAVSGHMAMAPGAEEPVAPPAVLIQVSDTGIGIPEENRQRIFEAFYQVDNSTTREYGGTGLGLSIVKNFVEAHGGRVWVSSRGGGGSTFSVLLPISPPHSVLTQRQAMRAPPLG